ncbi:hypothetical protein AAZV13_06G003450 [Glycine max]
MLLCHTSIILLFRKSVLASTRKCLSLLGFKYFQENGRFLMLNKVSFPNFCQCCYSYPQLWRGNIFYSCESCSACCSSKLGLNNTIRREP